jgi:hypothetical protein
MADTKISDLTAITGADTAADDDFVVVDTSAAQTKRITRDELKSVIGAGDLNDLSDATTNSSGKTIGIGTDALANDDGSNVTNYEHADVILVGVSRSGKTPTSLYLALQYGIKAANYPFTDDDMDELKLPAFLKMHKKKIFGLTIDAERLVDIRDGRMANTKYSSARQCRMEVREVEKLYKKEKIPFLNTTKLSVEEITAKILSKTGLQRYKY